MPNTYFLFTLVFWLIFVVYWIISFKKLNKDAYSRATFAKIMILLFIVICFSFIYLLLSFFGFGFGLFPGKSTADIIRFNGTLICVLGIFLSIWSRNTIGPNWSGKVTTKKSHELVKDGPYKLIRHPIYAGFLLAFLGTALTIGELSVFLFFLFCIFVLWIKIKFEESILCEKFPKTYPLYQKRTKKLIPYIL